MKYVEKAGLIKFDFLGLTTLSIINECVNLIKNEIHDFALKIFLLDDKKTFQQLSKRKRCWCFSIRE